jgi:hypothetical protein
MNRVTLKRLGLLIGVLALALSGCGGSKNNGAAGPGGLGGGIGGQPSNECIPINGPIGFVGNQVQFDSHNLRGGPIPFVGNIGQMGTSRNAQPGPYQSSSGFGTISLQAQSTQYGMGNIAGVVQPSAQVINVLQTLCQYGGQTFCPQPTSQVCVSNVAIDMGYNGRLFGNLYLYLNGTQHGYVLTF